MIKLLVYSALILLVFAIGYLVKVFELASSIKGNNPNEITDKDNRLMSRIMMLFLIALFAFVIWNLKSYLPLMLPEAASQQGVS
jgi:hypothetical protein